MNKTAWYKEFDRNDPWVRAVIAALRLSQETKGHSQIGAEYDKKPYFEKK